MAVQRSELAESEKEEKEETSDGCSIYASAVAEEGEEERWCRWRRIRALHPRKNEFGRCLRRPEAACERREGSQEEL